MSSVVPKHNYAQIHNTTSGRQSEARINRSSYEHGPVRDSYSLTNPFAILDFHELGIKHLDTNFISLREKEPQQSRKRMEKKVGKLRNFWRRKGGGAGEKVEKEKRCCSRAELLG